MPSPARSSPAVTGDNPEVITPQPPVADADGTIHAAATGARQGRTTGHVRWILGISLAVIIVAFSVLLAIY